jgi:chlorobactene lauroyltransferase
VIRSRRNRLFETLFSVYVTRILKRHFFSLRIAGERLFLERDPSLPTVIIANHSNWWDGFVMLHFARKRWHVDSHLMMDIEQMRKYPFFRRLGVFSVDRHAPRSAVESMHHAVDLLAGTANILWIFPQGVLLPNDLRPLRFARGTARIIEKLGTVNLLSLALRYEYRNEQRPEIFARFFDLTRLEGVTDAEALTREMEAAMERGVDALRDDVVHGRTGGFESALRGAASVNYAIDLLHEKGIVP